MKYNGGAIKMNKQPRIENISLVSEINFVRGMELSFEQEQFPLATEKVVEMIKNPLPNSIRIQG